MQWREAPPSIVMTQSCGHRIQMLGRDVPSRRARVRADDYRNTCLLQTGRLPRRCLVRGATLNEVHSRTPPWAAESTTVCNVFHSRRYRALSLSHLSHTDHTNKTPHGAYQRKRGRGFSTVRADTTLPSYSSSMSNSRCIRTNQKSESHCALPKHASGRT